MKPRFDFEHQDSRFALFRRGPLLVRVQQWDLERKLLLVVIWANSQWMPFQAFSQSHGSWADIANLALTALGEPAPEHEDEGPELSDEEWDAVHELVNSKGMTDRDAIQEVLETRAWDAEAALDAIPKDEEEK